MSVEVDYFCPENPIDPEAFSVTENWIPTKALQIDF